MRTQTCVNMEFLRRKKSNVARKKRVSRLVRMTACVVNNAWENDLM